MYRYRLTLVSLGVVLWLMTDAASAQRFGFLGLLGGDERSGAESGAGGSEEIETDRDSFTPATTTTDPSRLIIESAYSFIDNRRVPETHSYPELILRHGVTDWLELRWGWNYEIGGAGSPVTGNIADFDEGESTLEVEHRVYYGIKAKLTDQDAWMPDSAMILQGYTPTGGESSVTDVSASYIFGWTLPKGWIWDSAVRYSTSRIEEDNFGVWAPSSVLKVPFGEGWKTHVEYFGILSEGRHDETVQHFFSTGVSRAVTHDVELGVRFGWGLNDESPNFFSNVGVGWRI